MSSAVAAIDFRGQAVANLRRWRESPPRFVRECFRAEPDPWQDRILEGFNAASRIALKACANPGKTALLAWLIWLFLATRVHPRVKATAITGKNLQDNLWAELSKWQGRSRFLQQAFTWSKTSVVANDHPATWWAAAATWNRSASPEEQGQTLAGLHEKNSMAVIDEAGGVPNEVLHAAEGVLANTAPGNDVKLVISGNPTHLTGPLFDACTTRRASYDLVAEITGDPDRADRAPRVSLEWARGMIQDWGRDHPLVRARVLGLFPLQATDALVGLDAIEDAYGRTEDAAKNPLQRGLKALGVDVARGGGDSNVVRPRDGQFALEARRWPGKDLVTTAHKVDGIARELEVDEVRVDDIGVGGGVTDILSRIEDRRYRVIPVNVGSAPTRTAKDGTPLYVNLRAQYGMEVAEMFRKRTIGLDESDRQTSLAVEATDLRFGFAAGGRAFKVEDKDQFRKRHNGKSPDDWDALVLAFATLSTVNPLSEGKADDSSPLRVSAVHRHGRATGIAGRRIRRSA